MCFNDSSKIIVTGGSGLVGKYLNKYLPAIYLSSKDFNLTKENEVIKMFKEYKPEVVVHLAAKVGGILENINKPFEYLEDNILMNSFVVKWSRIFNVKKFLGVLSSCAYADVSNTYPLLESNLYEGIPNENNLGYGYSKRIMGIHIDMFKKNGFNYSYIIPNNLYGEFETGKLDRKHFIGALLQKIKIAKKNQSNKITLFGDGSPLRQFTFAEDIARVIFLIIKNDIKENLNVGIEENLSIKEIAELALLATNSTDLKIEYDNTKPNGQYRKDISVSNFKLIFPDFKFTSYLKGMKTTYESII